MEKINNQKGISLVELIAALALVSIVVVLIMTTLTIGIKRSVVENDKVRLQQEANLLISKLLNKHREGDLYCLAIIDDELILSETKPDVLDATKQVCDFPIVNENFVNNLYDNNEFDIETRSPLALEITDKKPINPVMQDIVLSLNLSYQSQDKKASFLINTTLSRYKTN